MPSETGEATLAGGPVSPWSGPFHAGAAHPSLSALADSAASITGPFQNRAMFAPLVRATLTLATGISRALGVRAPCARR